MELICSNVKDRVTIERMLSRVYGWLQVIIKEHAPNSGYVYYAAHSVN